MPPRDDDSLADLHHMSRTAGLGSGDYVAINVVAVTAVIFGLASALVVVDPLFLAMPIVGLILSISAIYQIRNSNGTQSGMVMAAAGLLLALGFFSYKVGGQVFGEIRTRADRSEIESLLNNLGQELQQGDSNSLADAYGKFDSVFAARVPRAGFDKVWNATRASPYMGAITSIESNGHLKFDIDLRSGEPIAQGLAIVHLSKGDPRDAPRWSTIFRKENGHWLLENLPDVFPAPQSPAPSSPTGRAPTGSM